MKIFFEKLYDLANMLITGFVIAYIFKPEFKIFWKFIFPLSVIIYTFSTLALIYIEKKQLRQYNNKEKENGE